MGDLTTNFSAIEFASPDTGECWIDMNLVKRLQDLRSHIGKPIIVTSGCRSVAYNRKVGGVRWSQHLTGRAADITCTVLRIYDLAMAAALFGFHGVGIYPDRSFLHLDVRVTSGAKWAKYDGRYMAYEIGLEIAHHMRGGA